MNVGSHAPFRAASLTLAQVGGLVLLRSSSFLCPHGNNIIWTLPGTAHSQTNLGARTQGYASKRRKLSSGHTVGVARPRSFQSRIWIENRHTNSPRIPFILNFPNALETPVLRRSAGARPSSALVRRVPPKEPKITDKEIVQSDKHWSPDIFEMESDEPLARVTKDQKGNTILDILPAENIVHYDFQRTRNPLAGSPILIEQSLNQRAQRLANDKVETRSVRKRAERARRRAGPTWEQLFETLTARTAPVRDAQSLIELHGGAQRLQQIYDHVSNSSMYGVIAERPVIAWGEGTMRLIGNEPSLRLIKQRFDSTHEDIDGLLGTDRLDRPDDDMHEEADAGTRLTIQLNEMYPSHPMPYSKSVNVRAGKRTADEAIPPSIWTFTSLLEYVTMLVRSRPSSSSGLNRHNKIIAEERLMEVLFTQTEARPAVSWAALHMALRFLVEQKRTDTARHFLREMTRIGFTPTTETYNIHLLKCAQEQNFAAFSYWLTRMTKRRVSPNIHTWLALLLAAPTIGAKQVVAGMMQKKGLFAAAAFSREDSATFVSFSLGPFIDGGGTIMQYVNVVDNFLGKRWLTEHVVSRIAEDLGQRGLILEAVSVLDLVFARRKAPFEKGALHTLLAYCTRHCHTDLAIWLHLFACRQWHIYMLDHIVLDLLFRSALQSRMYNVAKIVWQFAAMEKELKDWMRRAVLTSLEQRLKPPVDTVRGHWKSSFGVVVCGLDPLADAHLTPEVIVDLERNRSPASSRAYLRTFPTLLAQALAMDKDWRTNDVKQSTSTEWKIANSIQLPFGRRLSEKPSWKRILRSLARISETKRMAAVDDDDDNVTIEDPAS